MGISIGNDEVKKIHLGSSTVSKIYSGSTLIWSYDSIDYDYSGAIKSGNSLDLSGTRQIIAARVYQNHLYIMDSSLSYTLVKYSYNSDLSQCVPTGDFKQLGNTAQDFKWVLGGTKMYYIANGTSIRERTASTPYLLSSLGSLTSYTMPVVGESRAMVINDDDSIMLIADADFNKIEAIDISGGLGSMTHISSLDVSAYTTNFKALEIAPDGKTLYISNMTTDRVEIIRLNQEWDLTGGFTYLGTIILTGGSWQCQGITIDPDGSGLILTNGQLEKIDRYTK
jgi:hypothetical protein